MRIAGGWAQRCRRQDCCLQTSKRQSESDSIFEGSEFLEFWATLNWNVSFYFLNNQNDSWELNDNGGGMTVAFLFRFEMD